MLSHLESEKSSALHHYPASSFVRDEMAAVPEVTAVPKVTVVPKMTAVLEIVPEEWQVVVE